MDEAGDDLARDEGAHAVVDAAAGADDLGVVAQLLGAVDKIVGIHADAVAAHEARVEAQRVPLGVHRADDGLRVDAHLVKGHGDLVHEGDVDVALGVFDDLGRLGDEDVLGAVDARLDDQAVGVGDDVQALRVHAGDDLADRVQAVHLVAGVDALGRVADLEVHAALEAGLALQDGGAQLLRHARVDRRLVDDDRAGLQVAADGLAGGDDGRQVGRLVVGDGRGHGHYDKARAVQLALVAGEAARALAHRVVASLLRHIVPVAIGRDLALVDVKADGVKLAGERHRQRKAHISQAYDRQALLARGQLLKQVVHARIPPSSGTSAHMDWVCMDVF